MICEGPGGGGRCGRSCGRSTSDVTENDQSVMTGERGPSRFGEAPSSAEAAASPKVAPRRGARLNYGGNLAVREVGPRSGPG